ncbi:ATP-binding cassette domain-containing protein [Spiroplasma citri]|uniref:ATP-binding cassette domain-containing protein n=2 Tax=Spiroplasma citri TaxID=2133 RepID=Q14N84_SPICI|nr:ABC transporter ATP-binding protein [Spiroplasma citri]QIA67954.1 ATP-binding cassette domain-containing protein [Spiroplasma citri]QIA69819.1 ATP-binding cassette domain-containing protein [Spiroplasma citri]QIA71706.1 ATP-binding cassette domain-containing protein [Spiroplasma citri]QIA73805.1 ATP-binding cassette domain-containing protein [Spiroplasma citri]
MANLGTDFLVKCTNINKFYRKQHVLKNVSLTVQKGERIGVVGPNGTGKTTLCEILAQLRRVSNGSSEKKYGIRIGMQLQESKYPRGITGYDILNLYLKAYNLLIPPEKIYQFLLNLQIEKRMNKDISKLSGGQQQKINILLALIVDPDLIILDELATGLDLEIKDKIYEILSIFLANENKALLLISHNMEEIEKFCDTLIFMVAGEITKITKIVDVVAKYGSVEDFVKDQFKEYQIGAYKQGYRTGAIKHDKWAKNWARYIDKNKK